MKIPCKKKETRRFHREILPNSSKKKKIFSILYKLFQSTGGKIAQLKKFLLQQE